MPPTHHLLQPFLAKQSSILFQPSPLQAWGTQTPQLDLCIRETLRRAQLHSAVRKKKKKKHRPRANHQQPHHPIRCIHPLSLCRYAAQPRRLPRSAKMEPNSRYPATRQIHRLGPGEAFLQGPATCYVDDGDCCGVLFDEVFGATSWGGDLWMIVVG